MLVMFGFKLHRSKPWPISAFEYFGHTTKRSSRLTSMPAENPGVQKAQHDVIFLLNFFDELRRRVPLTGSVKGQ
ncbi:MAG: hypothetical protein KGN36_03785 [Acidobacteriota bacterium]|nr:hypothetical protein [Acidobacteriota bacterium]